MKTLLAIFMIASVPNLLLPRETEAERVARVQSQVFLPSQARWAADNSRFKAWEKCRQFGATWTEAWRSVDEASKTGALHDTWITSRDLGQARLFIADCAFWNGVHQIAARDQGLTLIDDDSGVKAFAMEFATGRGIFSMSSNPDAQAGKRGRRTADEFALHKDQRKLYAIMQPGLQWGGQMSLISTHRGTNSFFNREIITPCKEGTNKKGFSLHTVTIEQAVAEGLWIKIKAKIGADDERAQFSDDEWLQSVRDECPDEETWLQEYMCVPADDASAFLTWEEITACGETEAEALARRAEIPANAPHFIGFDVARKKHLSVITDMVEHGGVLFPHEIIVVRNTPYGEQERRFYEIMDRPTTRRASIDCTGLGNQLAERAALRYPGRVLPYLFTQRSKAELAFPLKAKFEDKTIKVLMSDSKEGREYVADLRSVKKETTGGGNIVITSEGGQTDGHADRFWSLALAVHSAGNNIPGFFERISSAADYSGDKSGLRGALRTAARNLFGHRQGGGLI